jgi:hypothetical protein
MLANNETSQSITISRPKGASKDGTFLNLKHKRQGHAVSMMTAADRQIVEFLSRTPSRQRTANHGQVTFRPIRVPFPAGLLQRATAPEKSTTSWGRLRRLRDVEELAMRTYGAVFQPELIDLMRAVLDDTTAILPQAKRTSVLKAEIASRILACAADGERDEKVLRAVALSAIVEGSHYSHDIPPERRVV